jgi:preprotein translocase subunit SecG
MTVLSLTLLLATWQVTLLATAFVVVCLFMMLVILIQKPKGGGLSGAFGGGGGSAQAAFGAKTGDVLTWFTVTCFVLFLLLAMGLTWTIRPEHERYQREQQAEQQTDLEAAIEGALRVPQVEQDVTPPAAAIGTEDVVPIAPDEAAPAEAPEPIDPSPLESPAPDQP